jgi:hypothetical protein
MRRTDLIAAALAAGMLLAPAVASGQGAGGEPVPPQGGAAPQMAPSAPGAAAPQVAPAQPNMSEPEVRLPSVDTGSDPLMQVPETYVAEPQINISPRGDAQIDNDYPTLAIADYVFGCMASNGQTQNAMKACSCSIDVIASILPYDEYIDAETTLGVRQVGGEKAEIFRTQGLAENLLDLRRAQAEAEMRCF